MPVEAVGAGFSTACVAGHIEQAEEMCHPLVVVVADHVAVLPGQFDIKILVAAWDLVQQGVLLLFMTELVVVADHGLHSDVGKNLLWLNIMGIPEGPDPKGAVFLELISDVVLSQMLGVFDGDFLTAEPIRLSV